MRTIARRDFLKAVPVVAGAMTYGAPGKAGADADTFWKRRIDVNAEVTIPFEVQKARRRNGARAATCSKRRCCR